jgi:hypothetical protein
VTCHPYYCSVDMSAIRYICKCNVQSLRRVHWSRDLATISSDRRIVDGNAHNPASVQSASSISASDYTAAKGSLPDINSTDIGAIPDPHTKDPKKWQKFAWKYVGALMTFGVAYKTLHWYVGRVEKEGKQRRDDMELNKTAKHETAADRAARREEDSARAAALLAQAQSPIARTAGTAGISHVQMEEGKSSADGSLPNSEDTLFQVFKPVQEDEGFVSQEDSLKLLEVELESKLKGLRSAKTRSREIDAEKKRIKEELGDLRIELATFAIGKARENGSPELMAVTESSVNEESSVQKQ